MKTFLICLMFAAALSAQSLQFTTTSLPDAEVTKTYDQTIQVQGGTSPYTFTINSGSLPEGLTLTSAGEITGVATHTSGPALGTGVSPNNPNGSRTYTAVISVSDSTSQLASRSFSITLWAAGAAPDSGSGKSDPGGCTVVEEGGGVAIAIVVGITLLFAGIIYVGSKWLRGDFEKPPGQGYF